MQSATSEPNRLNPLVHILAAGCAIVGLLVGELSAHAQTDFSRIEGKYLDIVTDLPVTDELRELTLVFERAMPVWCELFQVDPTSVEDWHADAFLMLERQRFVRAGLLPEDLPDFPYGFQYGDRLWVTEQPSAYYRRHLLLHEGTHWFMNRLFGSSGPPWLMEGMAEWLGTHQWDSSSQKLQMGIIPTSKADVPYWGRITRLQQQLTAQQAPSLEDIMRYSSTAHRNVDAYAWSWAAVVFLQHHPDTRPAFQELLRRPMRPDAEMTRWFYQRLQTQWPRIREEWRATATDLDYGFAPEAGLLQLSPDPKQLGSQPVELTCESRGSWQPSGWLVLEGQPIRIQASGMIQLAQQPTPWPSTADGVTLEYHRGQPVGRLLLTIASPQSSEPDLTRPLRQEAIGAAGEITAWTTGELHFRINESSAELADNSGAFQLTVTAESLRPE